MRPVLSCAFSFLLVVAATAHADVAPPEGQRFVEGELRVEHAERLTDHVIVAYPVVSVLRQPQVKVYAGQPIALSRYGMLPKIFVVPQTLVDEQGQLRTAGAPDPNEMNAFEAWLSAQAGVEATGIELGHLVALSDTDFTTYVERVEVVRASTSDVELRLLPLQNERGENVTRPDLAALAREQQEAREGCRAGGAGGGAGAVLVALILLRRRW